MGRKGILRSAECSQYIKNQIGLWTENKLVSGGTNPTSFHLELCKFIITFNHLASCLGKDVKWKRESIVLVGGGGRGGKNLFHNLKGAGYHFCCKMSCRGRGSYEMAKFGLHNLWMPLGQTLVNNSTSNRCSSKTRQFANNSSHLTTRQWQII